jgi:peptide subunit release factor 1 (eRF1)
MEEVEYHDLDRWGWECPKCSHWNETEEDPSYTATVSCESCGKEYAPVPQ